MPFQPIRSLYILCINGYVHMQYLTLCVFSHQTSFQAFFRYVNYLQASTYPGIVRCLYPASCKCRYWRAVTTPSDCLGCVEYPHRTPLTDPAYLLQPRQLIDPLTRPIIDLSTARPPVLVFMLYASLG